MFGLMMFNGEKKVSFIFASIIPLCTHTEVKNLSFDYICGESL